MQGVFPAPARRAPRGPGRIRRVAASARLAASVAGAPGAVPEAEPGRAAPSAPSD